MSGFVIAIVIIIVVISSLASQKQKRDRQNTAAKPMPPQQTEQAVRPSVREPLKPSIVQHVVSPSFQSGHAHQETSLSGDIPCGQVDGVATAFQSADKGAVAWMNSSEARRGIVYAEILGKPKALRKR